MPSIPMQTASVSRLSAPVTSTDCRSSTGFDGADRRVDPRKHLLGRGVDEDPGVHGPARAGDLADDELGQVARGTARGGTAGRPGCAAAASRRGTAPSRRARLAADEVPPPLPGDEVVGLELERLVAVVAAHALVVADRGGQVAEHGRHRPRGPRRWSRCWRDRRCSPSRRAATLRRSRSGRTCSSLVSARVLVSSTPEIPVAACSPTATATASSSSSRSGGSLAPTPSR